MNCIFLQDLGVLNQLSPASMGGNMVSGLAGLMAGVVIIGLLIGIAIMVYLALAHMAIARKAGQSDGVAGTAWVWGIGPLIVRYIISDMHWWPWLLLPGAYLLFIVIALFALTNTGLLIVGAILAGILLLVFYVYTVVWEWKMFEAVGRAGWWALIPVMGLVLYLLMFLLAIVTNPAVAVIGGILLLIVGIVYLVLLGIAAWGSGGQAQPKPVRR
jgi:hypothetical protein